MVRRIEPHIAGGGRRLQRLNDAILIGPVLVEHGQGAVGIRCKRIAGRGAS